MSNYRWPTKLLQDNVFRSVCLSVILSTEGDPMWLSPMMHCTSLYRDFPGHSPAPLGHKTSLYRFPGPGPTPFYMGLNVLGPTGLCPPDMGPHLTGTPASDIWYPRLVTCSNFFSWGPQPGTSADIWWLLKYVWLAREQFASYRNAFLLLFERLLSGAKFSAFNL